ncbi:MAG: ABC transporter permease, partial [Acidobacteriota bacterium]
MELQELFKSAFSSLRNNVMRTSLTMLGIIIGISSVILIVSIGQGAERFITNELSSFGTNYFSINPGANSFSAITGGSQELTLEDADAIREDTSLTNIQTVLPFATTTTRVSANDIDKNLLVQGATYDAVEILSPELIYGEFISEINNLESERVVVLGVKTAETFFGEDTDPVGEKIKIDDKSFDVIGVAKASSVLSAGLFDNSLYIPLHVMLNEMEDTTIQEIDILVDDTEIMNQTIADVEVLMRERRNIDAGEEDD